MDVTVDVLLLIIELRSLLIEERTCPSGVGRTNKSNDAFIELPINRLFWDEMANN